jgi:hypothetical protein
MNRHYPRGKLNEADEGALPMRIGVRDNTVVIDFGKKVAWIGMSKPEAIAFAKLILKHAGAE